MATQITGRAIIERWPLRNSFVISRGAKSEAVVVVAQLSDGHHIGRGECVPYARYRESPIETCTSIERVLALAPKLDRSVLQDLLPPGAARNALDCALWALEAASNGTCVADTLAIQWPQRILTCQTVSLDTPSAMAEAAARLDKFPLLKLKLGPAQPAECMLAVRAARPDARLVVDANEGWDPHTLPSLLETAASIGVELVEQPLPADKDNILCAIPHPVPICADESAQAVEDLHELVSRYDAVNIKLDKTGGLTNALTMANRAQALGLKIMVGCMVSTSLSMAPALHLAHFADWIDLDGPILLTADRSPGLAYDGPWIKPPTPDTWA